MYHICMILQDVDDKYDKKNTLPFLANCKTRSLFWHLKKMAERGYGLIVSQLFGFGKWISLYCILDLDLDVYSSTLLVEKDEPGAVCAWKICLL